MSSALRTFSQIEPTVKFLRAINTVPYASNEEMDTFLTTAGRRVVDSRNGINTIAYSIVDVTTASTQSAGRLVRDLGRRVTSVSTATGAAHRQIWLQVQDVAGPGSEGVADNANYSTYWIRIYTAADSSNGWARLG